jgi:hypothetical protein
MLGWVSHETHSAYLEGDETGISVGAADPLFGRYRRLVGERVGVEVLLEELGFPWHGHRNHLTQTTVVESVEARNFAGAHVTATLWHEANSSLRIRCLESVDVVDEWRLRRDFEVANDGVAFAAQEHQIRVSIVQREHDAVRCVQVNHDDRLGEGIGGAQTVLSLRRSVEPKMGNRLGR